MSEKQYLKFGKNKIRISVKSYNFLGYITPKIIKSSKKEESIVRESLDNPINSLPLYNFIGQYNRILIIIPDKTRFCNIKLTLSILLQKFRESKIPPENIKIIFATGSHSKQTEKEKIELLGKRIFFKYSILEHDAFNASECVSFGKTKFGTRLFLNRILKASDKIITIGAVGHHYFAGYGGGAKLIMPGLANNRTIKQNHKRSILSDGTISPFCKTSIIKNNPVYMDIVESVKAIPEIFSISSVMDERGKIINCFCGNIFETHKRAARLVDKYSRIKIKNKSDLVIVSAGGYPKDINFIQSHKSIHNAFSAVRDHGVIICLAECRDGIGSKTFLDWFQYKNEAQFKKQILKNYSLNAQTALSLKEKLRKVKIILVSKLEKKLVSKLGLIPAKDFNEAIKIAKNILGEKYNYRIIKNGSLVVAYD